MAKRPEMSLFKLKQFATPRLEICLSGSKGQEARVDGLASVGARFFIRHLNEMRRYAV